MWSCTICVSLKQHVEEDLQFPTCRERKIIFCRVKCKNSRGASYPIAWWTLQGLFEYIILAPWICCCKQVIRWIKVSLSKWVSWMGDTVHIWLTKCIRYELDVRFLLSLSQVYKVIRDYESHLSCYNLSIQVLHQFTSFSLPRTPPSLYHPVSSVFL